MQMTASHKRIIIVGCNEFNKLLPDQNDYVLIVPIGFSKESLQLRKVTNRGMHDLMPQQQLTCPIKPYLDTDVYYDDHYVNDVPFKTKELQSKAIELEQLNIGNIGFITLFSRNGRVIMGNCSEINNLIPNKNDYFGILPIYFNAEDAQIRMFRKNGDLENLLPNALLTSPYYAYIKGMKEKKKIYCQPGLSYRLNEEPFYPDLLEGAAKKLMLH